MDWGQIWRGTSSLSGSVNHLARQVYGDGDGLYLRVNAPRQDTPPSKNWVFVWRRKESGRHELGLGGYGQDTAPVSLAFAREKADAIRQQLARGEEARTAFDKVAPSPELVDRMVAAAGAWFSAWSAQDKPDAPRFTLAKWIEREEFECDPPVAFKPKERKAAPKMRAEKRHAPVQPHLGAISPIAEYGSFTAEITKATLKRNSPQEVILRLELGWEGAAITWHEFTIASPDEPTQSRGRAMLDSIADAAGIVGDLEETDDLLFRPLRITIEPPLTISYGPLAANDNTRGEMAA